MPVTKNCELKSILEVSWCIGVVFATDGRRFGVILQRLSVSSCGRSICCVRDSCGRLSSIGSLLELLPSAPRLPPSWVRDHLVSDYLSQASGEWYLILTVVAAHMRWHWRYWMHLRLADTQCSQSSKVSEALFSPNHAPSHPSLINFAHIQKRWRQLSEKRKAHGLEL
jgi:hypothetical protein